MYAATGSMPTPYRMHYQIAIGDLGHDLDDFGQRLIIHSQMLHGIKMKTDSNAAVIHD
jgi:hypothetical protein